MRKPAEKIAHTFRLDPRTLDALRDAAREDLRSMNSAVEIACRRWLDERHNEKGLPCRSPKFAP